MIKAPVYLKIIVLILIIAVVAALTALLTAPRAKHANAPIASSTIYKAVTRTYYVAAEDVVWDYAPAGKDPFSGAPLPHPWGDQTKYNKVRYIEYTDASFTVKKPQPAWLGILGPVIRAVEGDTINVVFYNKASKPYSMHPHGVHYDKDNEGATMGTGANDTAMMNNGLEGKGAEVMPGQKFTYTWYALSDSAPKQGEGGSKVWWYHSHVDTVQDTNDGLLGPIIISSAKYARPDATPTDVDEEFVTLFMIFDESKPGMTAAQKEANTKYAINGYIYDNLPGIIMNEGDKVRWHLLGMGGEADLHTPHWHGGVVLNRETDTYTDVMELLPGSMKTVDMVADNPGTWMFHCHVDEHFTGGMTSMYTINF
jgi:FtsP/CotA-like multicopper oxidase with cupredoxin domain